MVSTVPVKYPYVDMDTSEGNAEHNTKNGFLFIYFFFFYYLFIYFFFFFFGGGVVSVKIFVQILVLPINQYGLMMS